MKLETVLIFLVFLTASASAQSFHSIEADEQDVEINTTINLECTERCPVNSWRLNYQLPEGSEIVGINDSLGEITDYSLNSNLLDIETNSGERRETETLKINYVIDRPAEQVKPGLYRRQISLSGFKNKGTSGILEAENLISARTNHGFDTSFSGDMRFRGKGPIQLNFNLGNGTKTSYYQFFDGDVGSSEDSYRIALGTVGLQQPYERIPVAMYEEDYDELGFEWSAGLYKAGLIQMRDNEERERVVLTHETVHALSDRPLSWDRTQTSYVEEGVAKHAESLIQKKLYREGETDQRPGNLFGDDVSYTDGGYRYTVSSKGDREQLWDYYNEDSDFMMNWSPDHQYREFGYAYSELVIKKYVMNNGSVRELYTQVDSSVTESPPEKWDRFSELIDLEPCRYEDRERFESCLDEINSHEFEVKAGTPTGVNSTLKIDRIEIPERRAQKPSYRGFIRFLESIIDSFNRLLKGL